ncbi:MAG: Spy/CpxP family protein refolding chaperone [Gammaproteobacteria bacterium]
MNKFLAIIFLICLMTPVAYGGEGKHAHGKDAAPAAKKQAHHFAPHWAKTLNDGQKLQIDRMHLALERQLVVLKAREDLLQKELNALTARDDADPAAIHAKIDELIAVKGEIMRRRYDHIVEMRGVLTPEQRISYDMGVLGRSGVK